MDITIYGPALNVIETTGQLINYTTTSQPTSAVKADKAMSDDAFLAKPSARFLPQ